MFQLIPQWFYAFTLPPQTPSTPIPPRPANATPNPFVIQNTPVSNGKKRAALDDQESAWAEEQGGKRSRSGESLACVLDMPELTSRSGTWAGWHHFEPGRASCLELSDRHFELTSSTRAKSISRRTAGIVQSHLKDMFAKSANLYGITFVTMVID